MIDWNRVRDLRAEIGDDNLSEVVELFLDEVEAGIFQLGSTKGRQGICDSLHFLKGCAWNLGFSEFGALCHDGERRIAAGQEGAPIIEKIVANYGASKREFMAGLDDRSKSAA